MTLGYDKQIWDDYGEKQKIQMDFSSGRNRHAILAGASGSGKSMAEVWLFYKLVKLFPDGEFLFADFKNDFEWLNDCKNYYPFMKSFDALEKVYQRLHMRISGEDKERNPVVLIFDEYGAALLALDKTRENKVKVQLGELLMLSRGVNIIIWLCLQRADAEYFPRGAREQVAIAIVLGAARKSVYDMLIPSDLVEQMPNMDFGQGEGLLLLQGSKLHQIKIPTLCECDMKKIREICKKALS